MTRLVSGVALAASAFALVWFLPSPALLAVALVVAGLAFLEYAKLARAVDAPLPFLPSLAATLAACAAVALPWVHVPSLFGVIIVALAVSLMTSGLHGAPLVHGAAAGMLAPVYIGLPLGALVGIHQGRVVDAGPLPDLLARSGRTNLTDAFLHYAGATPA